MWCSWISLNSYYSRPRVHPGVFPYDVVLLLCINDTSSVSSSESYIFWLSCGCSINENIKQSHCQGWPLCKSLQLQRCSAFLLAGPLLAFPFCRSLPSVFPTRQHIRGFEAQVGLAQSAAVRFSLLGCRSRLRGRRARALCLPMLGRSRRLRGAARRQGRALRRLRASRRAVQRMGKSPKQTK